MHAFASDAFYGLIDGTGVVRMVSKPSLDLKRSFWTNERSNRHVTPIRNESRKPRCCQPGPPRSSVPNQGRSGAITHKPTLSMTRRSPELPGLVRFRGQLLIFGSEFQLGVPELWGCGGCAYKENTFDTLAL
jgi:hypothetical protein